MVAEARAAVVELCPDEVEHLLESKQLDLILDIREFDEWQAEHIPGARHAPRGRIEWLADPTYERHVNWRAKPTKGLWSTARAAAVRCWLR